ncbi:hypothetical protein [Cupriavidus sp. TMH.W2]|uniref:hypothetical protein n=1 Tax=Cupriavidus sp. TMH.W2 TaxID=3434465 RepID=UPI003D77BDF4
MPRGKIRERTAGKLVDTWHYEYEGIRSDDSVCEDEQGSATDSAKRVEGIKVPVELRLHKKFVESVAPPLATKEVWFTVQCKEPAFCLTGSDIEALRAAMWEKLNARFAVRWEQFYLVEIRRDSHWEGRGSGLKFVYNRVERGTAWDGTLLMRKFEHRGWKITPWPGEFKDEGGKVMACIPATKENETALDEFGKRIDSLRERLADFLRPHAIMETLSNLSQIPLLSAA